MTFHYLATPYTKYQGGVSMAYLEALRAAARCTVHLIPVFSPIVHFHPISAHIEPQSHEFWMQACAPFMSAAASVIVVKMPGWEKSAGLMSEIEHFRDARKIITFLHWPLQDRQLALIAGSSNL